MVTAQILEFAALSPSPELAGEHAQVLRVIDRSIDATQAASLGVAEYQADIYGVYIYFEETPGWQRFQSESTSIGREYDAAVSAWTASRQSLVKRLSRMQKMPPLPADRKL